MTSTEPRGDADPRYTKRLSIVVPYRNRQEHLAQFLPHMVAYFQRDKLDRQIPVTINIIEQHGDAPFNRGKLANCGFALTRETSDYIVVHDVDYLPMWADYSWSAKPARLIWHGLTLNEDRKNFFGAVELLDNAVFAKVNGFPNCYWGWGPEDLELSYRLRIKNVDFDRRDGTYIALPHKHAGFSGPHVYTEEGRRTNELFEKRQANMRQLLEQDGVSTLSYKLVDKKPIAVGGDPSVDNVWHYTVDVGAPEPGAA